MCIRDRVSTQSTGESKPLTMAVMDDDWDEAYHTALVRYISVQKELLALRREHEQEVGAMQTELEDKEEKMVVAEKTVDALADKAGNRQEKVKQLNQELSEVQELLLETDRDHKKLSKKLSKLRSAEASRVSQISTTKLENDKMREQLKAHNRKLSGKMTELIGLRHSVYTVNTTASHIPVSYTHLRAHETPEHLVCRLLLEKKKKTNNKKNYQIKKINQNEYKHHYKSV
eukprot:TRINITY_DN12109_c0_g1_i3.p1 TRINITY_DN12109_c0_g1~~TRINITY_DN12109_c0_g1_i3.p1  ORF type:complete len:230 (-),score=88.35 TRINITY_DN12109_c0_g1_i3:35-724(-)